MATFHLTANRWKKVAEDFDLRSRSCLIKVTTGRRCDWDRRIGGSGHFRKSREFMLFNQKLYIRSPVATTCTRTWLEP